MQLYKLSKVLFLSTMVLVSSSALAEPYDRAVEISRCAGQMRILAATMAGQPTEAALNDRANGWRVASVMELILDGWDKSAAFTVVDSEMETTQNRLVAELSVLVERGTKAEKQRKFFEFSSDLMKRSEDCFIHNDRVDVLIRKMRESLK
jgi:hypothetical protein